MSVSAFINIQCAFTARCTSVVTVGLQHFDTRVSGVAQLIEKNRNDGLIIKNNAAYNT